MKVRGESGGEGVREGERLRGKADGVREMVTG